MVDVVSKMKELKTEAIKTVRKPSAIAAIVVLLVVVIAEIAIPDSALKNVIASVLTSVFAGLILVVFIDSKNFEQRIDAIKDEMTSEIESMKDKVMLEGFSDMMSANKEFLGFFNDGHLVAMIKSELSVLGGIPDQDDSGLLLDLCINEALAKLKGVCSPNVKITRVMKPHRDKNGAVDAWKIVESTDVTFSNMSDTDREVGLNGIYESGRLTSNSPETGLYQLNSFAVHLNGNLVYDESDGFKPVYINTGSSGHRSWKANYPVDDAIPTKLKPGEQVRFVLEEEFFIPPMEELKIRWHVPRKGLTFTVKADGIDAIPTLSLTGCSLCEDGIRHHRCVECERSGGKVEINPRKCIKIKNTWAGSEIGINVNWAVKQKS